VTIAGRQFWLWRAVDDEGEVLDLLVQRRRKTCAIRYLNRGGGGGIITTAPYLIKSITYGSAFG
jgi:hypothetical protein